MDALLSKVEVPVEDEPGDLAAAVPGVFAGLVGEAPVGGGASEIDEVDVSGLVLAVGDVSRV